VSRRLALVLLVVFAVPALALAADTDPQRKINPADERKAASIVFKKTDFAAGWKRTTTRSDDENVSCSFYDPDGSDLTLTGDAEAEFEHTGGFPSVLSYGGVVITESLFVRPGIGRLLLNATLRQDYPVVQGIVILGAFVYTLLNAGADLLYHLLDPRV